MPRAVAFALFVLGACSSGGGGVAASEPRVVTLMPSGTEIVAALGEVKVIVGVDEYSTFPAEVTKLPKVGSYLYPNLEAIVRLRPTLVIVDDIHGRTASALHDAGIATVECAVQTLPDIKTALRTVGARLGQAKTADAVVAAIDATLDAAATHRPAHHPRVLVVIDREAGGLGNLVAAGPGSWTDELLAVVGGDNVLAASGIRYPRVSLEEVLRAQPEVIIDLSFAGKGGTAPWSAVEVPAVKANRVIAMSDPYLLAPSPRVAEALAALTGAIE